MVLPITVEASAGLRRDLAIARAAQRDRERRRGRRYRAATGFRTDRGAHRGRASSRAVIVIRLDQLARFFRGFRKTNLLPRRDVVVDTSEDPGKSQLRRKSLRGGALSVIV